MSETFAERVASVVEHNTGGPQSDPIDREHIMVILAGTDGTRRKKSNVG